MPLAAILRRASASMVPLATRAFRNQIALSSLFPVQSSSLGLSLGQKLTRPSFVPIAKFSTDGDENLLRVLEAEIDCSDDPKGQPITDRTPFEIHDNPGEGTILLRRKYGDEVIEAVVDKVTDPFEDEDDDDGDDEFLVPTVEVEHENDGDGDDECLVPTVYGGDEFLGPTVEVEHEDDGDGDGDDESLVPTVYGDDEFLAPTVEVEVEDDGDGDDDRGDEQGAEKPPSVPMVVTVSKGSGQFLEFGITSFADGIRIDSLSIKNPDVSADLAYEVPEFEDLGENLQKAFQKYLEDRGFDSKVMSFLQDYKEDKKAKEYLLWLNNLKKFVEK